MASNPVSRAGGGVRWKSKKLGFLGVVEIGLWIVLVGLITSPALGFFAHAPAHPRDAPVESEVR